MRVVVDNFRGIKRAEIDLSKVALIAGPNAAGKSSIAQAVSAALAGLPIPFEGLKKSEAGMLVHSGTAAGAIAIESGAGVIRVQYPQAKIVTEGTPPSATTFALGVESLVDKSPKEMAATLLRYLKALPTEADLREAAAGIPLEPKHVDQLWKRIADLGWDGAHQAAKESGIKLKAQWEGVTGERYGPAKAEQWIPAGWEADLDAASEETLQAVLTQARDMLEATIATSAVSGAERDRLKALAAGGYEANQRLALAQAAHANAVRHYEKCQEEMNALPRPETKEHSVACPHCQKAVVIRGQKLEKLSLNLSEAENAKRAQDWQAAVAKTAEANSKVGEASLAAFDAKKALEAAQDAARRVATLDPSDGPVGGVEAAREGVARAEGRLRAFVARRNATRAHTGAIVNARVQDLLAPEGLRTAKLRDAVRHFNGRLAALTATAGWGSVVVQDDLAITYSGAPLVLLSASERFRAAVTAQVALAELDGSAALVVDAADILDRAGRNGLMKLLFASGRPSLVCMTMPSSADVPKLKERGFGYWVEGGQTKAIGD